MQASNDSALYFSPIPTC